MPRTASSWATLARRRSSDAPGCPPLPGDRLCYLRPVLLRDTPGLPDPHLQPPTLAEAGDPFAALRVAHLLARIPRGQAVRVRDIVDQLNVEHLDWSFSRGVVVAAAVQLQANWQADYRNADGIVLREGLTGAEIVLEDTSRVDPWIVRQVERLHAECGERLRAFAIEEGAIP
ncbi:hypothetical protein BH23CHL8_BH23CHL8_24300 [soil metagenome]